VTDVTDADGCETRLTPEQQEALEAALEYGYFEIPRGVSMEELAEEEESPIRRSPSGSGGPTRRWSTLNSSPRERSHSSSERQSTGRDGL